MISDGENGDGVELRITENLKVSDMEASIIGGATASTETTSESTPPATKHDDSSSTQRPVSSSAIGNRDSNSRDKSPSKNTSNRTRSTDATAAASTSADEAPGRGSRDLRELNVRRQSLRQHRASITAAADLPPTLEFVEPMEGTPAAEALKANAAIKVGIVTKGLKKFRGMKRPKLKNLNLVKKLNKTTKHKRKNHFSKNFKGKVINGLHERYALTAGMMLGIRYSVGQVMTHANDEDDLNISDFNFVEKVTFPPAGSNVPGKCTPPHKLAHTYKFKSYAPTVFKRVREFFGIDPANYILSVAGDYNFIEFISNSKSGMYFFYSHDGKYMIKTQTKEENKFMKRILPHYYKFLTENPHTMMVQILGMYRVKMYHLRRKTHFVIMRSVFDSPIRIHTIYDLKGSRIGRSATQHERETGGVLKDNDLVEDGVKLHLGSKRDPFLKQLERDSEFLASLNIMDYSLLLGVHDRKKRPIDLAGTATDLNGTITSVTAATAASAGGPDTPARPTSVVKSRSNTPFRSSVTSLSINQADLQPSSNTNTMNGCQTGSLQPLGPSGASPEKKRSSQRNSKEMKPTPTELFKDEEDTVPGGVAAEAATTQSLATTKRVFFSESHTKCSDGGAETKDDEEVGTVDNVSVAATVNSTSVLGVATSSVGDDEEDGGEEEEEGEEEDEDDWNEEESVEEESDIDEGDSDIEEELRTSIDNNIARLRQVGGVGNSSDDITGAEHATRSTAPNSIGENSNLAVESNFFSGEVVVQDAVGAMGSEGYRLSKVFRSAESILSLEPHSHTSLKKLEKINKDNKTETTIRATTSEGEAEEEDTVEERTYGPGITFVHPWTSRADGGINSRTAEGSRGDEIYFAGIIDILQEYNFRKYGETIFKGFTQDVSKLSSVDSKTYAKRFVNFMRDNSD